MSVIADEDKKVG